MKAGKKALKLLVTVLLLAGGLVLCRLLYLLFDRVMNGFVVDWFEENYVLEEWVVLSSSGEGFYQKSIKWWKVKRLLLETFSVSVVLGIVVTRMVSLLYASRQEKKVLGAVGEKIGDFMHQSREASEVFPKEYAPVTIQMAQIKANMERQERMLKEEAARKSDLITYLAHDLKTPLTSVIGYLSLLDEAADMPAEQREKYVHVALDKALRLERLINEFFDITRYNLQQIVLEKESVDLSFLLVQLTDEFYPILSAHGNRVRLDLGHGEGVTVYGDAEKLARVFNNILKNAVAYSYPDTEIQVRLEEAGGKVKLFFSNQGRTIPHQKLELLFEKFFRLDDAGATNTGGAGLGLAIAREIVTLHGGAIRADSRNEVTTFTVELPGNGS